jgi:hypothetical protein
MYLPDADTTMLSGRSPSGKDRPAGESFHPLGNVTCGESICAPASATKVKVISAMVRILQQIIMFILFDEVWGIMYWLFSKINKRKD